MSVITRRISHDINVEKYRLASDTDTQAVQRALNIARAAGTTRKRIILPVAYDIASPLDVAGLNGTIIEGTGPDGHALTPAAGMSAMFRTLGAVSDLHFLGLNFQGTAVDDATGPRRSRTWATVGMGSAISLYGDRAPQTRLTSASTVGATSVQATGRPTNGPWYIDGESVTVTGSSGTSSPYTVNLAAPLTVAHASGSFITNPFVVRNVRLESSRIQNVIWASTPGGAPALPFIFGGVRGEVEVVNHVNSNTYDSGFVFNDYVKVDRYSSLKSADNGISVSRGNRRADLSRIDVSDCAYNGIWVAGFNDDLGPTNFLINGANIKNVGHNGITADAASKRGTIQGFNIDGGYFRGPSDQPTDSWGAGIYVGGYPSGSLTPTDYAEDIAIGSGRIGRMPRAGVALQAVKDVSVIGVKIRDIGTATLADGTPIASNDANNNVGVLVLNSSTSYGVTVQACDISDWRDTPLMNYQVRPSTPPTAHDFNYFGNSGKSGRNTYDLIDWTEAGAGARTFATTTTFNVNTKHRDGATAGTNAGTGTIIGFDHNGAAGSVRQSRIQTGGVNRWGSGGTADAESSTNAGTDYIIQSYADTGATLAELLRLKRAGDVLLGVQGKKTTLRSRLVGGGQVATVTAGAQAATAAAASNGATDLGGTVNATAVASPAAGAIAVVTFATPFDAVPHVVMTPQNAESRSCQPYIGSRSASGFTIFAGAAATVNASLQFDYIVVG